MRAQAGALTVCASAHVGAQAAKRDRVRNLISAAVVAAKPATVKEAVSVAEAEASKAMEEDMTGTLTAFSKAELEKLAKAAFKEAKSEL